MEFNVDTILTNPRAAVTRIKELERQVEQLTEQLDEATKPTKRK